MYVCTMYVAYKGTMALSAANLCSVDQDENEDSQLSINEGREGEG